MSTDQVVRAWRDRDHWLSLTDVQRSSLPANPAGAVEMMDEELERIIGGYRGADIHPNSPGMTIGCNSTRGACNCICTRCGGTSCVLTWWTGAVCCT
jgi:mersacidin/lichenicidin family type 2 lantibiotic